jgi:glycosyltransferase involved in cell wall biosynthesis
MNILWVSSPLTDTRGGALTVTKNLILGLDEYTHTYLGSCGYMGEMFLESRGSFVKSFAGFEPVTIRNWVLFPVSFLLGFFQVIRYRKLYKKASYVIVATAHCEVFFTIPWVILFFRKPVIVMNHTGRCPRSLYNNPFRWIMSWVYNSSQVVFVSKAHKKLWQEKNLVGKNAQVVYNGISVYKDISRSKGTPRKTVFGYLGRIETEKGLDVFFKALQQLGSKESIEVILGGTGKDEEKYKKWADQISQRSSNISFRWLGQVQDTKSFFESIHCLVFPSNFESFGIVMVEAWERGLPVLSSNIPAFLELKSYTNSIEKDLIFDLGNPTKLLEKMQLFLDNKNKYLGGKQAEYLHKVVAQNFSVGQQVTKIKQIMAKK